MRVLVLPGLDGGASLSTAYRAALAEQAIDAHAIEYGADARYDALLAKVRSAVAGPPCWVVAESFSGPIAIRLAAEPPDALRGVLLVATFARAPAPRLLRAFAEPMSRAGPPPGFAIRRLMIDADGDSRPVAEAIRAANPTAMAERVRQVLAVHEREPLARPRVPVHIVRASHDRLVAARRCASAERPDLPCTVVEGPHLLLHTRPRELCSITREVMR